MPRAESLNHHLFYDQLRGWSVRFTIRLDRKNMTRRMKTTLKTHQEQEARERRDLIIKEYIKCGFLVVGWEEPKK